jgi:Domain of unknown function (DUF2019)
MSYDNLKDVSVGELVSRFAEICIAQDTALLHDELEKFTRLFREMRSISEELKSRPGDQRQALLILFEHPNIQVRLKAAKATLAVAPAAARHALEEIKASQWQPQAGEAGMSLWNLEQGIFKPT